LIEATAIGRALITTDVPGCREICTDNFNGFLVPPATSQPIVEALKGIYLDPLKLESMCRNSNAVFQRGYDSEQVVGYTLSAYAERLADS
jgi:glycosyltransferase involved in cell wall biosynthesis